MFMELAFNRRWTNNKKSNKVTSDSGKNLTKLMKQFSVIDGDRPWQEAGPLRWDGQTVSEGLSDRGANGLSPNLSGEKERPPPRSPRVGKSDPGRESSWCNRPT